MPNEPTRPRPPSGLAAPALPGRPSSAVKYESNGKPIQRKITSATRPRDISSARSNSAKGSRPSDHNNPTSNSSSSASGSGGGAGGPRNNNGSASSSGSAANSAWKPGDSSDKDPMKTLRDECPITREDVENAVAFLTRGRLERITAVAASQAAAAAAAANAAVKDGATAGAGGAAGGTGGGDKDDAEHRRAKNRGDAGVSRGGAAVGAGVGTGGTEAEKGWAARLHVPTISMQAAARMANNSKIGKEDLWNMIETYFPELATGGTKTLKVIMMGKEEITKEQLVNLLINRSLASTPFEEAYQFFADPDKSQITIETLKSIAEIVNPYGLLHKGDIATLMKAFDRDLDGVIGLDDFKRMSISM